MPPAPPDPSSELARLQYALSALQRRQQGTAAGLERLAGQLYVLVEGLVRARVLADNDPVVRNLRMELEQVRGETAESVDPSGEVELLTTCPHCQAKLKVHPDAPLKSCPWCGEAIR